MTLSEPHLGDSRFQELRSSSLKNATLKNHRVLDPIKINPFVVPTTIRKEAPTGIFPVGATHLKAVTNCFPQVGRNQTTEALKAFSTPLKGTMVWKSLPPMTP